MKYKLFNLNLNAPKRQSAGILLNVIKKHDCKQMRPYCWSSSSHKSSYIHAGEMLLLVLCALKEQCHLLCNPADF